MDSLHEEQVDQPGSSRLSFRRKFWLFGVGLPVFLMIVLLALAVFLPKPLNPTERQLLGRWVVVDPADRKGHEIAFGENYVSSKSSSTLYLWEADENSFSIMQSYGGELMTKLKIRVGFSFKQERYLIEELTEQELKIRSTHSGSIVHYRRIGSPRR